MCMNLSQYRNLKSFSSRTPKENVTGNIDMHRPIERSQQKIENPKEMVTRSEYHSY